MKKIILVALAIFSVSFANAQIADQIKKSRDRAAKLEALSKDYKTCGNAGIDGYGNDVKNAAALAIANSVQLENLYKREIGESADGVQDVTVTKPKLEDWTALAATVAGEAASIKSAVDKAKGAGEEAKNVAQSAASEKNPMKKAKAAKNAKGAAAVIEFGNAATPILLEESAAQVKAVEEIIKTLKAGKNL
ncbi:MAG: hypothetical protein J6O49_20850 [Bacteroidaceae bacterium]|nr:hypothetical protein [Bacteroidaceae bacterium]